MLSVKRVTQRALPVSSPIYVHLLICLSWLKFLLVLRLHQPNNEHLVFLPAYQLAKALQDRTVYPQQDATAMARLMKTLLNNFTATLSPLIR